MKIQSVLLFIFRFFLQGLIGCARVIAHPFVWPPGTDLHFQTALAPDCAEIPLLLLLIDSIVASDPENKELRSCATKAFIDHNAAHDTCIELSIPGLSLYHDLFLKPDTDSAHICVEEGCHFLLCEAESP